MTEEKPNQKTTWAPLHGEIETLDEFLERRSDLKPAGRLTALSLYLNDQLEIENKKLKDNIGFHQIADYATHNNRLGELLYAKMALVHYNSELAEKLVKGHRLHPDLHEEYVENTKCYG